MPKLTIYLQDSLAAEIKRYGDEINVSQVCQEALAREVSELNGSGRQMLVDFLLEQAKWRSRVAEDYPEDGRNEQSAAALTGLAEFVQRIPVDHPAFVAINILDGYGGGGGIMLGGSEFSSVAGRFGFANKWIPPTEEDMEQFVTELVDTYVSEWLDEYIDGGSDDWEEIAEDVGVGPEWIEHRKEMAGEDMESILSGGRHPENRQTK